MPTIPYYKADVPPGDWQNENPTSLIQYNPNAVDYTNGRLDLAYLYDNYGSPGYITAIISFIMPGPLTPGVVVNSATLYLSLWGSFDDTPRWEPMGTGTTLVVRIRRVLPVNEWDTAAPGGPCFNYKHFLPPSTPVSAWAGGPGCDNVGVDLGTSYNDTAIYRGTPWTDSHYQLNCTNAVQEAVNAGDTRIRLHLYAISGSQGKLTFRKTGVVAPDLGPGYPVGPSITMNYTLNTPPTAPDNLKVEGSSGPVTIDTLVPYFTFRFNDPNVGDLGKYYRIEVSEDEFFGGTSKWDSGQFEFPSYPTEGTVCDPITYNHNSTGTDLEELKTYYWRAKCWDDSNDEGPWSTTQEFSTRAIIPYAPSQVKINGEGSGVEAARGLFFSAVYSDPYPPSDTALNYRVQVNTGAECEIIGTVDGASGFTITDASLDLEVDDIGVFNIVLTTGARTIEEVVEEINAAYRTAYNAVKASWPESHLAFVHTDGPAEYIKLVSRYPKGAGFLSIETNDQTEIGLAASHPDNPASGFTGAMKWDSGKQPFKTPVPLGERCEDIQYDGYELTPGETYYVRMKFWDNDDNESPWSAVT